MHTLLSKNRGYSLRLNSLSCLIQIALSSTAGVIHFIQVVLFLWNPLKTSIILTYLLTYLDTWSWIQVKYSSVNH